MCLSFLLLDSWTANNKNTPLPDLLYLVFDLC